jgi:hypothetical protein
VLDALILCIERNNSTVQHFLHYPVEVKALAFVMLTLFLHLPYEIIISRTDVMFCTVIRSCSPWCKRGLCGCKGTYRKSMLIPTVCYENIWMLQQIFVHTEISYMTEYHFWPLLRKYPVRISPGPSSILKNFGDLLFSSRSLT